MNSLLVAIICSYLQVGNPQWRMWVGQTLRVPDQPTHINRWARSHCPGGESWQGTGGTGLVSRHSEGVNDTLWWGWQPSQLTWWCRNLCIVDAFCVVVNYILLLSHCHPHSLFHTLYFHCHVFSWDSPTANSSLEDPSSTLCKAMWDPFLLSSWKLLSPIRFLFLSPILSFPAVFLWKDSEIHVLTFTDTGSLYCIILLIGHGHELWQNKIQTYGPEKGCLVHIHRVYCIVIVLQNGLLPHLENDYVGEGSYCE